MRDPWAVRLSLCLYQWLLGAYPQEFRCEYEDEMAIVFRDLCLQGGTVGLAGVWGRTLPDYVISLVSEHIDRGVEMTKSKWIQISGWGLAASGFLFAAGLAASSRPAYNQYNSAAWAVDPYLNAIDLWIIVLSLLLMCAGFAGMLAHFQDRAGKLGQAGLVMSIIASLVSAVGAIGLGFHDGSPWWETFSFSFLVANIGLVLFGIACLRNHLFTKWNGLPLVVGGLILAVIIVSLGLFIDTTPDVLMWAVLITFTFGLGMIGYRVTVEADGKLTAVSG
jgi:hypothetical protein